MSGSTNGTGAAARFYRPSAVALDGTGNLYVADAYNHTIRKVTAAGVVTTFAGTALLPGSADGTGTAASFFQPRGVAVDGAGNVYVADNMNHTIRKITAAGVVTTLAGYPMVSGARDGTGTGAFFYQPNSVAVDSAGNVYVAEAIATIRKVTAAGVVTTIAGTPAEWGSTDGTGAAARFESPWGVTFDGVGNLYVADTGNSTIRKVTVAGVVTTLAGVAKMPGTADGSASTARFRTPWGVAVDNAGNIYVADTANHTIRKVTVLGYVTTLAGVPGMSGSTDS
jgi:hypothetical protein